MEKTREQSEKESQIKRIYKHTYNIFEVMEKETKSVKANLLNVHI